MCFTVVIRPQPNSCLRRIPFYKASDTPYDFIRRSRRSAKIARCARCSVIAIFADRRDQLIIKSHVRCRRLNSPIFTKCARDFLRSSPRIALKSTNQVWRFHHITFQNAPRWSPGTRLECHIAAIGEKIARCVHINRWRKSLAIFVGDQIRRDGRIKSPGVSPA